MTDKELKKQMAMAHKRALARKKKWKDAFPMTVKKLILPTDFHAVTPSTWGAKPGAWVAVAPCDPKFGGKTFLGMMVGNACLGLGAQYDDKKKHLIINEGMSNPLMIIPENGELVYGCGSWWHEIKKPEDLKNITQNDINNVWYVKLMKDLVTTNEEKKNPA